MGAAFTTHFVSIPCVMKAHQLGKAHTHIPSRSYFDVCAFYVVQDCFDQLELLKSMAVLGTSLALE